MNLPSHPCVTKISGYYSGKAGKEKISDPVSVVRLSLCKLAWDHALHMNTEDVRVRTPDITPKMSIRAQGLTESRHSHGGCTSERKGEGERSRCLGDLVHCATQSLFPPSFV